MRWRRRGELTYIFLNECKGKTELRLPVDVLKYCTGGLSWKGIVCGGIIAKCLAPATSLHFTSTAVIRMVWNLL